MTERREKRVQRSAEWAAFGDALGFITELADPERVQHRLGVGLAHDTVGWRRKVGGYNGVSVDFPPGTYSDDTQLRLATGRAIRADGSFDVAAFAKVELTAWANYALGAGTGSKEAAANLARTSATWYSNFFETKRASYVRAGGNGAAMRVQPHVWAARDLKNENSLLIDVVRNAICTHGHPRGILGACLHALTLAFALREGRPAGMAEVRGLVDRLNSVPKLVEADGDLKLFWLGPWEEASGTSLTERTSDTVREIEDDIDTLMRLDAAGGLATIYDHAIDALGAKDPHSRGSGTKTAVLAAYAASLSDPADPRPALLLIANALGSDTDSIATMTAAIIGACSEVDCNGAIQDRNYINAEALRLAAIAVHRGSTSFRYPDLRSWKPARAAIDAVGLADGHLWLNGLGELTPLNDHRAKVGEDALLWCRLGFGQTILARVRETPHALVLGQAESSVADAARNREAPPPTRLRDLFRDQEANASAAGRKGGRAEDLSLSDTLQRIIAKGFPPDLIGKVILEQVDRGGGDFVERGVALTATILTAYEARIKRRAR